MLFMGQLMQYLACSSGRPLMSILLPCAVQHLDILQPGDRRRL